MPKHKRRAVSHTRRAVAGNRRRPHAKNRRKNPTRIMVIPSRRNRGHRRRVSRNPMVLGQTMNAARLTKVVAGVIVGVGVVKMAVPMLPTTVTSSPIFKFASAVAVAVAAGWALGKVSPDLGGSVLVGGLAEAASIGLNNFLPISQYTGLSGLGTYVPAQFNEPQNPILIPAGGGLGLPTRVYGGPYTRRAA